MSLVACSSCRTLVLSRDLVCPFCGAGMRTIVRTGTMIGTLTGAAVLASGIGCVYGVPCATDNCKPPDGGLDVTVGNLDGGKMDGGDASMDAISDALQEADSKMDAAADATDAPSD